MNRPDQQRGIFGALARHSLIYGVGSALGAAGGFLLIPLYTHVLATEQYGLLELLNRIADILLLVMFMGLRQAYIRFYFEQDTPDWRQRVTGSTLVFVLASGLILASLFWLLHEPLLGLFADAAELRVPVMLLLLWMPAEMVLQLGMVDLQVRLRSLLYVLVSLLRLIGFIALNVYLIWVRDFGVVGVLLAQALVTGLIALGFLGLLGWQTRVRCSAALVRRLLAFGLPYLPAAAFMYVVNNGDRYVIGAYESLAAVGIYALAHKIGMMGTQFLMDPFNKVWSPFLFRHYSDPGGPRLVGRVYTLYTMVSLFVALGISLAAPVALPWISAAEYHGAATLVPLIALASVFYGMSCLGDAGILIAKRTRYKPLICALAALVSVLANFWLVPRWGATGAAVAAALAFLTLLLSTLWVANHFYRMWLPRGRIVVMFALSALLYLLGLGAMRLLSVSWVTPLIAGLALAAFPLLMWHGGFLLAEERSMVTELLRRLRRGAVRRYAGHGEA
ncbi:lipopolysaccharide biosynthesis protein [Alkalilimnicola sp. S0819]|uniref:lipopolysaccharide biosynthesis protein n=1 Tax=Alkalilimnicola sp. S0819 TaxID=2613922 RepID=UPI001869D8D2|nr:oligosaccharide flippase family protein [Alkalilimnicola sp. S0819]